MTMQQMLLGLGSSAAGDWDLASAVYDNISFSVASQQNVPSGLAFNDDGTKMYVCGSQATNNICEYALSIAWDISSATFTAAIDSTVVFTGGVSESDPRGIFFKPDGTIIFVVGNSNDYIFQGTLSTPWDITTTMQTTAVDLSGQTTDPTGIFIKSDGTKMYVSSSDGSDSIYQYTLTTPWTVAGTSYDGASVSISAQDDTPANIFFKPDGMKIFVLGSQNQAVYQYGLSFPWDISTATYDSVSFSVNPPEGAVVGGLSFKPDGTKMYTVGATNDTVYQYSL